MMSRPCERCRFCFARRKRDRSGRGAAQAAISAEVVVVTATYRPGEPGAHVFITSDRSKMLRAIRDRQTKLARKRLGLSKRDVRKGGILAREAVKAETARIVFLGCGEPGSRRGRIHWHILLFFDKPSEIAPSVRFQKGKTDLAALAKDDRFVLKRKKGCRDSDYAPGEMIMEHRNWWPRGGVTVDVIPGGRSVVAASQQLFSPVELIRMGREGYRAPSYDPARAVDACRYAVKYLQKGLEVSAKERAAGKQPKAVFFASNSKAYGVDYMVEQARETARQGLPYHGRYTVPGVNFGYRTAEAKIRNPVKAPTWSPVERRWVELGLLPAEKRPQIRVSSTTPPQPLTVQGACCRPVAAAYVDEWQKVRPGVKPPATRFLQMHYEDYHAGDFRNAKPLPHAWHKHGARLAPLGDAKDKSRIGTLVIRIGREVAGVVECHETGAARFHPASDRYDVTRGARYVGADLAALEWLPSGDLSQHLPFCCETQRKEVEQWLHWRRGPYWLSPPERNAEVRRRAIAQHSALLGLAERHAKIVPDYLEGEEPLAETRRHLRLHPVETYIEAAMDHVKGSKYQNRTAFGFVTGWLGRKP